MKKIILSLLFATLICSSVYAQNTVAITQQQAMELKELGIMVGDPDGNMRYEDNITRSEAAKMICTLSKTDIQNIDDTVSFPDVAKDAWEYKYVCALKRDGIICGDENGNFNPDAEITNEEIIKMVVNILGYSPLAEQRGGYPAGYTATASIYGLTKGLSLEVDTPATRLNVASIIYRALDTCMMVEVAKTDAYEYKILDGKNGHPKMTLRDGVTLWDTSRENVVIYAQDFASQYEYKEGDTEKSFELYPDIVYTSGVDKTRAGKEFEWPAFYDDNMAQNLVSAIKSGEAIIDGTHRKINYIIFADKMLIPAKELDLQGVSVSVNPASYVATVKNEETVLEILPNLIGMRKNRQEGYWVPLEVCARIYNNEFYVPLDAILYEFGFKAEFDADKNIIKITNKE